MTSFDESLELLGWTDPGITTEATPSSLDPLVQHMTTHTIDAPSPADPTPPGEPFGRFAGLFGTIAVGAGVLTWHVL